MATQRASIASKAEVPTKKRHPEFIQYILVPHPMGYTSRSANWLSCQFVIALRVPRNVLGIGGAAELIRLG